MQNKKWSELSPAQQAAVVALGIAEAALTTWAAIDLVRRDRELVRGPKIPWALGLVVQPVGPIAYLALGRRSAPVA